MQWVWTFQLTTGKERRKKNEIWSRYQLVMELKMENRTTGKRLGF